LSSPDTDITDGDKVAIAGIFDRVKSMRQQFDKQVEIRKGGEATDWYSDVPEVTFPTGFFNLEPPKQVEDALVAIVGDNSTIAQRHRTAFVETVKFLREAAQMGP